MYNKIRNPNTNRWVNVNSKLGNSILNQYLRQSQLLGGSIQSTPVLQGQLIQQPKPAIVQAKPKKKSSMFLPKMSNVKKMVSNTPVDGKKFFNTYNELVQGKLRFRLFGNSPKALNNKIFKINMDGTLHLTGARENNNPCVCKVPGCGTMVALANKATSVLLDIPVPKGGLWYGQATIHFSGMMLPSVGFYFHDEAVRARGGYCKLLGI